MKLSDDDLIAITTRLVQEADAYLDEKISPERAKAMRYYMGENPDPLKIIPGRSKMVVTEVRDTIEWVLPDLVRIFAGDDDVVSIEPSGEEDTFQADVATEWVNYVVMRQNSGFLNTYCWIKDALLSKVGFLSQHWEVEEHRQKEPYQGLTESEYQSLVESDDYLIKDTKKREVYLINDISGPIPTEEYDEDLTYIMEDGEPAVMTLYDVDGYVLSEEAKIKEVVWAPENVKFLKDTESIPFGCRFIGYEEELTIGELREMHPDVDIPDDISGPPISQIEDEEESARNINSSEETDTTGVEGVDPSQKKVYHYILFCKLDRDGDGRAEWLQIHRVGSTVLSVEEIDYPKVFTICPIPWPHQFVGLSFADVLYDLQDFQTMLNRQVADHIGLTNNPRHEVARQGMTETTLDDLLDSRIGGYVEVETPGTVNPLIVSPLAPWTFSYMELWEQKREARTGVSRMSGGLDPNTLNKTATGVVSILNQAARRIELIARVFAETGFKDRMRGILDLSAEFPDYVGQRVLRLTGKQIQLAPEALRGKYDLIVNPGVGSGNRDQLAQSMLNLLQIQMQILQSQQGFSDKQLVDAQNLYNTVKEYISKVMGKRNSGDFINDPENENTPPIQPAGPPPEMLKLQQEGQIKQAELQQKAAESERAHQVKMAELALKERELELKERELGLQEYKTGGELAIKAGQNAA